MATSDRKRRDDPIGRVVAANLRKLRRSRELTQEQTAQRLAPFIGGPITGAAIQQWETGADPDNSVRRFSVSELWAMCRVFRVPLAGLLLPEFRFGDRDSEVPDLFGEPYLTIWTDCFEKTADWKEEWASLVYHGRLLKEDEYAESHPEEPEPDPLDGFNPEEVAKAVALLRQLKEGEHGES